MHTNDSAEDLARKRLFWINLRLEDIDVESRRLRRERRILMEALAILEGTDSEHQSSTTSKIETFLRQRGTSASRQSIINAVQIDGHPTTSSIGATLSINKKFVRVGHGLYDLAERLRANKED